MEPTTAGMRALERYALSRRSGDRLGAAADLVDARVALDATRAELERKLAEVRSAYDARYHAARLAGWTTEELRMHFGCRPPAFEQAGPVAWPRRGRPGAG
jgi:hypothetical protein